MATTESSASTAQPTTPNLEHVSGIAARVLRGQELYREHATEIRHEDGVWFVPSQHDVTSVYEVVLGLSESCECQDYEHRGGSCKHIIAATVAKAKTASCAGCGARFRHRELCDVGEDSLAFFEGDLLCPECAADHGVA